MTRTQLRSDKYFLLLTLVALLLFATSSFRTRANVGHSTKMLGASEGCWLSAESGALADVKLLTFSGNLELDNANQREGLALIQKFGVTPRGFFFDDSGAPNAFATNKVQNNFGPDGTIAMGLTLINSELSRDGGSGLAVPAIMAHEFAHIVQYKRNSQLSIKEKELQADYLAGWYLGNRWIYTDTRAAFQSFFEMGDYQFNSPNHHGTPKQRLSAIKAGFEATKQSFDQAYNKSAEFVKSL